MDGCSAVALVNVEVEHQDAANAPLTLHTTLPFAGNAISRQARRLYIGNIPTKTRESERLAFLNESLIHAGGALEEGNPVGPRETAPINSRPCRSSLAS